MAVDFFGIMQNLVEEEQATSVTLEGTGRAVTEVVDDKVVITPFPLDQGAPDLPPVQIDFNELPSESRWVEAPPANPPFPPMTTGLLHVGQQRVTDVIAMQLAEQALMAYGASFKASVPATLIPPPGPDGELNAGHMKAIIDTMKECNIPPYADGRAFYGIDERCCDQGSDCDCEDDDDDDGDCDCFVDVEPARDGHPKLFLIDQPVTPMSLPSVVTLNGAKPSARALEAVGKAKRLYADKKILINDAGVEFIGEVNGKPFLVPIDYGVTIAEDDVIGVFKLDEPGLLRSTDVGYDVISRGPGMQAYMSSAMKAVLADDAKKLEAAMNADLIGAFYGAAITNNGPCKCWVCRRAKGDFPQTADAAAGELGFRCFSFEKMGDLMALGLVTHCADGALLHNGGVWFWDMTGGFWWTCELYHDAEAVNATLPNEAPRWRIGNVIGPARRDPPPAPSKNRTSSGAVKSWQDEVYLLNTALADAKKTIAELKDRVASSEYSIAHKAAEIQSLVSNIALCHKCSDKMDLVRQVERYKLQLTALGHIPSSSDVGGVTFPDESVGWSSIPEDERETAYHALQCQLRDTKKLLNAATADVVVVEDELKTQERDLAALKKPWDEALPAFSTKFLLERCQQITTELFSREMDYPSVTGRTT
jgi:hypothetical protein